MLNESFRPLWGSCLSQFCWQSVLKDTREAFPSPMGIMSVSMGSPKRFISQKAIISVPYGDHVCLNWCQVLLLFSWALISVPYGDHVCLNTALAVVSGWARLHFRPLWGSCLSQWHVDRNTTFSDSISVPYGDHVCLNAFHLPIESNDRYFRPLWGSCLSQWKIELWQTQLIEFPSPMGIMSVSIEREAIMRKKSIAISVPYGDHVCLNGRTL